jgi:DNA-binding CsgD family transcriptional regulator
MLTVALYLCGCYSSPRGNSDRKESIMPMTATRLLSDLEPDDRRTRQLAIVSDWTTKLQRLEAKEPILFGLLVAYRNGERAHKPRVTVLEYAQTHGIKDSDIFDKAGRAFQTIGLQKSPAADERRLLWEAIDRIVPTGEPEHDNTPPPKRIEPARSSPKSELELIELATDAYARLPPALLELAHELCAGKSMQQLAQAHGCTPEKVTEQSNDLFRTLHIDALYLADKLRILRTLAASSGQPEAPVETAVQAEARAATPVKPMSVRASTPAAVSRPAHVDPEYRTYREITDAAAAARAQGAVALYRKLPPSQREILRLIADGHSDETIAQERSMQRTSVASLRSVIASSLRIRDVTYPADRVAIFRQLCVIEDASTTTDAPPAVVREDPVRSVPEPQARAPSKVLVPSVVPAPPKAEPTQSVDPPQNHRRSNERVLCDGEITNVLILVKKGMLAEFDISDYVRRGWRFRGTLPIAIDDGEPLIGVSLVR